MGTRTLTTTRYTPSLDLEQEKKKRKSPKFDSKFDKDNLAWQKEYLTKVLIEHQGNRGAASRATGIERTRLLKLIKRLKITVPHNGPGNPYMKGLTKYGCVFVVGGELCGHAKPWHANVSAGHEYLSPPAATPDDKGGNNDAA